MKMSQFTAAASLTGTEGIPLIQAGANVLDSLNNVKAFVVNNIYTNNGTIATGVTRDITVLPDTVLRVVDNIGSVLLRLAAGSGTGQFSSISAFVDVAGGNGSVVNASADVGLSAAEIYSYFDDGATFARIRMVTDAGTSKIAYEAVHHNKNLVEYADNAAAITGGLEVNDEYHTAGVVKIVI